MDIEDEIREKREAWRKIREKRLNAKQQLLEEGKDTRAIRKDPAYRQLKKQQHHLSTRIKHLEKELNRKRNTTGQHTSRD